MKTKITSKENLIISILKSRLGLAKKQLSELEKQKKEYQKIPMDCLGKDVFNDGFINENSKLREDLLTNIYHQIGYFTAMKYENESMLKYLKMSEKEIKESLEEDDRISKQNDKYLKDIFDKLKTK